MAEGKTKIVTALTEHLTEDNVKKLKNAIKAPDGIFGSVTDPTTFLFAIHDWKNHNKYQFDCALQNVRPDLVEKARELTWLSSASSGEYATDEDPYSMKAFVYFLKTEPSPQDWKKIFLGNDLHIKKLNFSNIIRHCFEGNLLKKDLKRLRNEFGAANRHDLAENLGNFVHLFSHMTQSEFKTEFKLEAEKSSKPGDTKLWKDMLQIYTFKTYSKIKPVVGSAKSVNLKDEFIPLTIVSHSMGEMTESDDGTERELDMLEKFYKQESIPNIDFVQKMKDYDTLMEYSVKFNIKKNYDTISFSLENSKFIKKILSLKPKEGAEMKNKEWKKESWCLVGNPGSGKTFLCSRIALLYGSKELKEFDFSLSIPCRKQEWHRLESIRLEREIDFTPQMIQQWVKLGLPASGEWINDLSEHIVKTEGKRVLLIIDSIDEFTKSVPFEKTLLCLLLQRKCLRYATILFTSRPGAWYDITSQVRNMKINVQYKVLGFSPKNRDLYISVQLTEKQFKQCQQLFYYYNEIRLLCLVPVNASLIVSLFQSSSSVNINSLTELYSYLTLHLILRQLSRMGLEDYIDVLKLFDLDKGVLKCLQDIGEVAYTGVAFREMISSSKILLRVIGKGVKDSECLGLVNVSFIKETTRGKKTKVWSFSHLTMQEFVASIWLHSNGWRYVCLVTRFVVSSNETFAQFKMVMRFVCGLLAESALPVLSIVFTHLLEKPLPYSEMSLCTQFRYENYYNLDYALFTNQFITIASLLVETNSHFLQILKLLPDAVSFYIESMPAPNEWLSFINSLRFFERIHLIQFSTDYINPTDFSSLLEHLGKCTVKFIAVEFSLKSYPDILPYLDVIKHSQKSVHFSIDFNFCSLDDTQLPAGLKSLSTNHSVVSMNFFNNITSIPIVQILKNKEFSSLKNLYFYPHNPINDYQTLLPQILSASSLQGLHLYHVPDETFPSLLQNLSSLSQLQEFSCVTRHAYSTLSQLTSLSKLNHLYICGNSPIQSRYLVQFLRGNESLRALGLKYLESVELISLNVLFAALHTCSNLVCVKLETYNNISFVPKLSISNLRMPSTLVYLEMLGIQFQDKGLLVLIKTIVFHRKLRYLKLCACLLTSKSCVPLCNLISTLRRLKTLKVEKQELSKPDGENFKILTRFADLFSIELET